MRRTSARCASRHRKLARAAATDHARRDRAQRDKAHPRSQEQLHPCSLLVLVVRMRGIRAATARAASRHGLW